MSVVKQSETEDASFQFIVSSGPRPDPAARKTIRRQAMKDVGLSRRRRNDTKAYENQLILQGRTPRRAVITYRSNTPISSSSLGSNSPQTSTPSTEATEVEDTEVAVTTSSIDLPAGLDFASGEYWSARASSNVDLSSLTIFTNFNIGKSTIAALANSSYRLPTALTYRQWSYLEHVPRRYPHSPCVAAATDCVLARVGNALSPQPGVERSILRLYAKALRLVQTAIIGSSCTDSDVLCAVQLLSLSELFDISRSEAWASHVQGSARLIRHRSVTRFETEFEKALFAASVGPYVSECLYNGTHCYLAEPHWKELYMSLSLAEPADSLSERSGLVLGLRSQMFPLPGLWSDIGRALEGDDLFDDNVLEPLAQRCREAQEVYMLSLEGYKALVLRTAFLQPSSTEIALRREFYGLAHEGLILVKRLQASVCDADRLTLEIEVQNVAQIIFDMQDQPLPQHSWLFSGHELGVAQLALSTSNHFTKDVSTLSWRDQRVAMRERYKLWSGSLRGF